MRTNVPFGNSLLRLTLTEFLSDFIWKWTELDVILPRNIIWTAGAIGNPGLSWNMNPLTTTDPQNDPKTSWNAPNMDSWPECQPGCPADTEGNLVGEPSWGTKDIHTVSCNRSWTAEARTPWRMRGSRWLDDGSIGVVARRSSGSRVRFQSGKPVYQNGETGASLRNGL